MGLAVDPALAPAVVDCALYRGGTRDPGAPDVSALYEQARRTEGAFVWIGLHEPDEKTFAGIAEIFGLHPLAVEDVLQQEQRPKLERYEDVTFLIVRAAQYVDHAELTETSEIVHTGISRIFIGEDFVVTVRHGDVGELRPVRADLEARPELLAQGPWAVVHAVVDRVVDGYVEIADAMQTDLDAVEASAFSRDPSVGIEQIAGVYGMNFVFMPELQWRYGYVGVLAVMVLSAFALHRRLRRAGWL